MDEDQRLEAIKDLLVGSSFERINSNFKRLNQRVENGNSHLGKLLKDLKLELNLLRSEHSSQIKEEKKIRFADNESLKQRVKALEVRLVERKASAASADLSKWEKKHTKLQDRS